jgi:hypothetical protein
MTLPAENRENSSVSISSRKGMTNSDAKDTEKINPPHLLPEILSFGLCFFLHWVFPTFNSLR